MSTPKPLRIACLHGYRQNAQRFRQKTGALRKALERDITVIRPASAASSSRRRPVPDADRLALAELVYIDAPFIIEKINNVESASSDGHEEKHKCERAVYSPNISSRRRDAAGASSSKRVADMTQRSWLEAEGRKYFGWEKCIEYLRTTFREEKFDGILGFSQGAIVASLICGLRNASTSGVKEFASVRFAILISGLQSRADAHQHLYGSPIDFPSLHVWGAHDELVPPWMSKALLDKFHKRNRRQLEHSNGHLVPSDAESRAAICDFLLQFVPADDASERPRAAL